MSEPYDAEYDADDSPPSILELPKRHLSEADPPRPVDKELLRKLHTTGINNELLHWEISSLVGRYRIWAEAEKEVLYELLQEEGETGEGDRTTAASGIDMHASAIAETVWLAQGIDWRLLEGPTSIAAAKFLTAVLCARMAVRPVRGTRQQESEPAEDIGLLLKHVTADLSAGMPATLLGSDRWMLLRVRGDRLEARVGRNAADRSRQFRLEFRRGTEVLVVIEAREGVAVVTLEHLRTAEQGRADQLLVFL